MISSTVKGNVYGEEVNILLDSGSQCCAISDEFYKKINSDENGILVLPVVNFSVTGAVGKKQQRIKQQVLVKIEIGGCVFEIPCIVVPHLNRSVILGSDWFLKEHVKLDYDDLVLAVDEKSLRVRIQLERRDEAQLSINFLQEGQMKDRNRHRYTDFEIKEVVTKAESFDEREKVELLKLVKDFKGIAVDQVKSDWISRIVKQLEKDANKGNITDVGKWYVVYKGVLFKRESRGFPGYKLCIPKEYVISLIQQQHADLGHFGYKKILHHMRELFFWPKMAKNIRQVVTSCELCQKTKISKGLQGTYNAILPEKPGQLLTVDLMGPLPPSRGGATQLFVVVDNFTKFTKLYALRRATARSIVNKLERYFSEILTPEAVLSDNGTQFHSAVYIKCLAEKGVKSIYTSVYFPSGNPTERMNREIGRLLRCFCSTKHTKWACVLPRIEHCLNNIVHESTGQVPAMLMFGKSEPNDIFKLIDYPPGNPPTPDWTSSLQLASNNLRSKARKRKEMFENKNKAVTFTVGDSVLVKTHPISSAANAEIRKLFVRFDGPYVVSRIVGPNSYMLKNIEGVNVGPQNIRNLKLYKRCPTPDQL
ncbi:unnamed protein product [Acanthoscelides obtectus]|uniref:RNA-directed DNA polymerase n=1 Tax=Acanthoscelides obtectus TaxID=200917 RepID=A0A9P0JHA0_ACAOB|nr:unnamed protein product [Acanthoscelides obtectus]CAK1639640.1 Pro-Pol polyprotein [Acanthoscelides obtectus]